MRSGLVVLLGIGVAAGRRRPAACAALRPGYDRRPIRLVSFALRCCLARMMAQADEDSPQPGDLEKELASALETREFNRTCTSTWASARSTRRPSSTRRFANGRRRRPALLELAKRRATGADTPNPNTEQTPGEVIELVLRALRDVDWPTEGHGIEVLRQYSGPASILGEEDKRPEITPKMLIEYFASSKYSILLDWVQITYLRKLELSLDRKRALQQIRLTSRDGVSVPVTFQLSKHANPAGSDELVWLIDQLLVKSIDM